MALQLGCSYAVEEVTSGTLELLEFTMYSVDNKEKGNSTLEWNYPVPTTQKVDSVYDDILSAVAAELELYESVVLCLANFYPIHVSGVPTRGFETAPNSMTESEAHLESLLLQHYDVDIVTVAITVADDYCTVVAACVLDYLPMLPDSVATANDALDETQIRFVRCVR